VCNVKSPTHVSCNFHGDTQKSQMKEQDLNLKEHELQMQESYLDTWLL
jgi:hypothetical protein